MKILLTTLNAKYIHKNLALRWIYQARPAHYDVCLKEYTIRDDLTRVADDILQTDIDVMAFSTYIWNIEQMKELVYLLKKRKPDLHIIAGGPEVSFSSVELLDQGIDALSIGEGEQSIWEYIEMLVSGVPCEIEGIYTKSFPNLTYRKVPVSFLESLPNPYFMEMDADSMEHRYLYLETSRGCPYGCSYCLSSVDSCLRMFSDEYVFSVLDQLARSQVRQVKLLDRTFNADPKRALRIARYMNTHCVRQIFQFEIVAETLSDDLLHFFCEEADKKRFRLEIGVQSFHTQTLHAVRRIQNNTRLQEVIFALRNADVTMHVDLIAGLPYEGYERFRMSFDTLFAYHVKEIQLGILKLLKGTDLWKRREEYGLREEKRAPYAVYETKWLCEEEMQRIEGAAAACEKLYNSGRFQRSIEEVLRRGWFSSPFDLFVALGERMRHLPHPYSAAQLYYLFLEVLPVDAKYTAKCMLTMDYYACYRQRPQRLWKEVSMEKRKALFQLMIEQGREESGILYHYGVVDIGYFEGECGYQVIVFQRDKTMPKRYFIDAPCAKIKELE